MLKNGEWVEDDQRHSDDERALDRRKMDDAERIAEQGDLARQRQVLDSLRLEIENRAGRLEEEARALAELAASLSQREEALRTLASDQEKRNNELDRRQHKIERAETQFAQAEEEEISIESESEEELRSQLAAEQESLDDESSAVEETAEDEQTQGDTEEISFTKVSSESPLSTASLLAKYGLTLDDEPDLEPAKPSRTPPSKQAPAPRSLESLRQPEKAPEPPAPVQRPAAAQPVAEEEDDIGEYMARLMQRSGAKGNWSPSETPANKTVEPAKPVMESVPAAPEPPKEPMRPKSPRPMPEMLASLSAMRELANMNARTQINAHVRKEFGDATIRALAMLCIGLFGVAIFSWRYLAGDWWAFNATCAAVLGAVVMGARYIDLMRRLKQKLVPSTGSSSEE